MPHSGRGAARSAADPAKLGATRDLINDAMWLRRLPSLEPGRRRLIPVDALAHYTVGQCLKD